VDEEEEVIEVEFEKGWLWESIELINFGSKGISHVKFAKDMTAHYLENRVLLPGVVMKGYLGLPVPVGTPIEITLRKP
jgi:hypothetical protein